MTSSPDRATAAAKCAIALTGATLRVAVTSVGAQLPEIQAALHLSGAAVAWLAALPVLCFAVFGAAAPLLAGRAGPRGAMVAALLVSTVGLAGRALTGSAWVFGTCTVLALAGAATGNVLMPVLVRRHGGTRPGAATALYTSTLALASAGAAAGTTALAAHVGWRGGIGVWALLDVAAACGWLVISSPPRTPPPRTPPPRAPKARRAGAPARQVAQLAMFFGFQSVQSYTVFGWFPTLLRSTGSSSAVAGTLVGLYAVVAVPVYLVAPRLPAPGLGVAIGGLGLCQVAAYLGLIADPAGLAWLWMALAGLGSGAFAVALHLTATASRAPAVSAMVQGGGYLLAVAGPLMTGLAHEATGGWTLPLALLCVAAMLSASAGLTALPKKPQVKGG